MLPPLLEFFEAPTRQLLTEFYDAAADPDPVTHRVVLHDPARAVAAVGRVPGDPPDPGADRTDIPFEVGTDLGGDAVARMIHDMRMAIAINTLGLPAVALPEPQARRCIRPGRV